MTKSGIVLANQDRDNYHVSKVIDIGPDVSDQIKVGDQVIHKKWSGQMIENKDDRLILLKYEDILCVVETNK